MCTLETNASRSSNSATIAFRIGLAFYDRGLRTLNGFYHQSALGIGNRHPVHQPVQFAPALVVNARHERNDRATAGRIDGLLNGSERKRLRRAVQTGFPVIVVVNIQHRSGFERVRDNHPRRRRRHQKDASVFFRKRILQPCRMGCGGRVGMTF